MILFSHYLKYKQKCIKPCVKEFDVGTLFISTNKIFEKLLNLVCYYKFESKFTNTTSLYFKRSKHNNLFETNIKIK